jgi:hypothetical protein
MDRKRAIRIDICIVLSSSCPPRDTHTHTNTVSFFIHLSISSHISIDRYIYRYRAISRSIDISIDIEPYLDRSIYLSISSHISIDISSIDIYEITDRDDQSQLDYIDIDLSIYRWVGEPASSVSQVAFSPVHHHPETPTDLALTEGAVVASQPRANRAKVVPAA